MSDSEDHVDLPAEGGDDLFGDGDGEDEVLSDAQSDHGRALSDNDLASEHGDDYGGGYLNADEEATEVRNKVVMTVPMYRHRIPKSKDNQLQALRVPQFLKWDPEEYKPKSWQPSKWAVENAKSSNPIPVVRFRRDPATGELQSNTNVYKWSDGSVTMAVGGDHYEIQTKSLAPPVDKPYQEFQDAHYYTAAAHLASNSLLIIGRVTEQYTVRPNKTVEDDALERLQRKLEEAKKASTQDMIITTREDPELQKKQAELAEKERTRAQRRRETAAARVEGAASRYNRGALSIGDLEGRRGAGGSRKRGAHGTPRKRNRNPEYDSDDDLPAGTRRMDDYVLDDFAVASDEEASEEAEDDDEEEVVDEDEDEDEDEEPRRKRHRTTEAEDEDADGEADLDDVEAHTHANRRRRHIIDDDDDEDDE